MSIRVWREDLVIRGPDGRFSKVRSALSSTTSKVKTGTADVKSKVLDSKNLDRVVNSIKRNSQRKIKEISKKENEIGKKFLSTYFKMYKVTIQTINRWMKR